MAVSFHVPPVTGAEQTHRVLAMQATYRHEFIQNAPRSCRLLEA